MTSFSQRCSDAGLSAVSLVLQAIADGREPTQERLDEAQTQLDAQQETLNRADVLLIWARGGTITPREANHYCLFDFPPRPLDEPVPETLRGADDVTRGSK